MARQALITQVNCHFTTSGSNGWRHTRSSLVGIDIIEAADIVAEGSLRSSSIMPEDPAQPGHRQRVGGQSRLSRHMRYTILQCSPQTTASLTAAQARWLSVLPPRRRWSAATTARLYKDEALSGNPQKCPLKTRGGCEGPSFEFDQGPPRPLVYIVNRGRESWR